MLWRAGAGKAFWPAATALLLGLSPRPVGATVAIITFQVQEASPPLYSASVLTLEDAGPVTVSLGGKTVGAHQMQATGVYTWWATPPLQVAVGAPVTASTPAGGGGLTALVPPPPSSLATLAAPSAANASLIQAFSGQVALPHLLFGTCAGGGQVAASVLSGASPGATCSVQAVYNASASLLSTALTFSVPQSIQPRQDSLHPPSPPPKKQAAPPPSPPGASGTGPAPTPAAPVGAGAGSPTSLGAEGPVPSVLLTLLAGLAALHQAGGVFHIYMV